MSLVKVNYTFCSLNHETTRVISDVATKFAESFITFDPKK